MERSSAAWLSRGPFLALVLAVACKGTASPTAVDVVSASPLVATEEDPQVPDALPLPPPPPPASAGTSEEELLPAADGLPEDQRAIQVAGAGERVVDANLARARGFTVVDLSDSWAPSVLADGVAPDGTVLPNRYRAVFVGLADDRSDGDGQPLVPARGDPLRPIERNYLELYGIPPSLSVLRERFLSDADRTCDREIATASLLAVNRIETWGSATEKEKHKDHHYLGLRLEEKRRPR